MCPNSVDTPPPNNPTSKPIRPRDQLSQPASHQREAYQLPALSAGVAYGSPTQEVARLIAPIAQGWNEMKKSNAAANDMAQPALMEA